MAIEKILDLQSLVVLLTAGALAAGKVGAAALCSIVLAAFWGTVLVAPWDRRLLGRGDAPGAVAAGFTAMAAGIARLLRARRHLAGAAVMSLAASSCSVWIIRDLLAAAGTRVAVRDLLLAWPVAVVASAVPIALSGIGTRDLALLACLALLEPSIDRGAVLIATLLFPIVTTWLFALIGAPVAATALFGQRLSRGASEVPKGSGGRGPAAKPSGPPASPRRS